MNKKLPKVLLPGAGLNFVVMVLFCVAAAVTKQYYLAAAELVVTLALFVYFQLASRRQRKEILKYLQSTTASLETAFKNDVPFPMAIVSIIDGDIHWCNSQFAKMNGLKHSAFNQSIHATMPDFSLKWLAEGKPEAPSDYVQNGRRYRVVGNQIHDGEQDSSLLLATIYLLDVTELLDTRDAFNRTRPVVSIILIDNYDELIHQQTDGAISNLDGALNDCLTQWTADTGGLLRKLERNRYLYLFESKDLAPMTQGKFSILEYIRTVSNKNGLAATISMGIGKDGDNFLDNFNHANLGIEMSLSR
ncbi:MAG: DHH family phosphoesterase, partial [Eubacteriales bacterium]